MNKNYLLISSLLSFVICIISLSFLYSGGYLIFHEPYDFVKLVIKITLLGIVFVAFFYGLFKTHWRFLFKSSLVIFIIIGLLYVALHLSVPGAELASIIEKKNLIHFLSDYVFSMIATVIGHLFFSEVFARMNKQEIEGKEILVYYFLFIILIQIQYYVFGSFSSPIFGEKLFTPNLFNHVIVLLVTTVCVFVFYSIQKTRSTSEKKIIIQSTKVENISAQFQSLKSQLDPHFLFNSLNVLTGLIEENQDKAIDFTSSLSKIYRYVLEQREKEVIPVMEEINFAKSFVGLLKLRYENSIDFEINELGLTENEKIVPLALQILLENAIKHNIVSPEQNLKIRIYKEMDMLVIENNYQPKKTIGDNTGIGLQNIINRYELVSNRRVIVTQDEEFFKVKIPLLTYKNIAMTTSTDQDQKAYEKALKRAKKIKKFYSDLFTFIILGVSFYWLDYFTTGGNRWWFFPVIGFVLATLFNIVKIFAWDSEWEERKANEILEKENQRNKWS